MNELYHSDVYLGKDYSDGIRHFKYIKREKLPNGKWKYYYKDNEYYDAKNSYNTAKNNLNLHRSQLAAQQQRHAVKRNKYMKDNKLNALERYSLNRSNAKLNKIGNKVLDSKMNRKNAGINYAKTAVRTAPRRLVSKGIAAVANALPQDVADRQYKKYKKKQITDKVRNAVGLKEPSAANKAIKKGKKLVNKALDNVYAAEAQSRANKARDTYGENSKEYKMAKAKVKMEKAKGRIEREIGKQKLKYNITKTARQIEDKIHVSENERNAEKIRKQYGSDSKEYAKARTKVAAEKIGREFQRTGKKVKKKIKKRFK